jgi:cell division ATPase FtsA
MVGVEGTKMFGIGGRAFTKAIERDLDIDFVQAEALKLALETNKVPEHKRTAIIESLNNTLDVWIEGVGLALDEFKNVEHLPHHIMLCGGGASLDLLVERLEESTWYTEQAFYTQTNRSLYRSYTGGRNNRHNGYNKRSYGHYSNGLVACGCGYYSTKA